MAELLTATRLDAEQDTYVAAIRSSGSALASLIEEILDFSKIEAGKVEIAEESFDVIALVESVAELLAPRAQRQEPGDRLDRAPPTCRRAWWAIRRGCGRSCSTSPATRSSSHRKGGVGLRVTRGPDDTLRFDVADTGPGIPAERRAAIFEEFLQAETAEFQGGTGLGLAISRRLAERMGGSLALAPDDGRGATFTVALPLPADPAGVHLAAATFPPMPQLGGCRALVVADSPFEALYLVERLGEAGAQVEHVAAAADGAKRLAAARYDIVFVDCALGGEPRRASSASPRARPAPGRRSCCSPPTSAAPSGRARRAASTAGWSSRCAAAA